MNKLKVGDRVYYHNDRGRGMASDTITKVGNKYAYTEGRFKIDMGTMRTVSEYRSYLMFRSEQEYNENQEAYQLRIKINNYQHLHSLQSTHFALYGH